MANPKLPDLHVEGRDDKFAIIGLLERHGIMTENRINLNEGKGDVGVIRRIPPAVKGASNGTVGFVLDIDLSVTSRWDQLRGAVHEMDVQLPDEPDPMGTILEVPATNGRIGFWLMPDNETAPGRLEDLLKGLIPKGDHLLDHAEKSTDAAKRDLGAKFSDLHRLKAVLHCWLAWQEKCGLPYGSALGAEFFGHDSPAALAFVDWIRRLYRL